MNFKIIKMKKSTASIAILVILYSVGLIGIKFNLVENLVLLTPINLLISLGIILCNHEKWDNKFLLAISIIGLAGFFVEVAGVKTGAIFGDYTYGKTLGWQWLDVPLVMAVNWLILIYCSAAIVSRRVEWHWAMKAFASAVILMTMDFLIEPVAIRYDFWQWAGGVIPDQNYLAWGGIAFVLSAIFLQLVPPVNNKVALALFLLQIGFFVGLAI